MPSKSRAKFQGVTQIVRFNWPFYLVATLLLVGGAFATSHLAMPFLLRLVSVSIVAIAAFWLAGSLLVAHYIYDRTSIYAGDWLRKALRSPPKRWATFHAGLDEFSTVIEGQFPGSEGLIVDFFDGGEMTEHSIRRARRLAPKSAREIHADFRSLPISGEELETAFVLFAAHELRKPESRARFFSELNRVLKPDGQVVLLEHMRDWPNFLAFGPGCFHFHSRRTWLETVNAAVLAVTNEFTLTPFVRAFVLEKLPLANV